MDDDHVVVLPHPHHHPHPHPHHRLEGAMRAIPPLVATPPLVAASSSSRTQDSHIPPADATARMLSVLQDYIHPNSHVLEIGTGSGYRAALLATLVGPGGHVTTVELDAAKAHSARRRLTEVWGMADTRVSVVAGDGTLPGTLNNTPTNVHNPPQPPTHPHNPQSCLDAAAMGHAPLHTMQCSYPQWQPAPHSTSSTWYSHWVRW